jgi:hypothetical protein
LQGFRNEESSKSEILGLVCAIRGFENVIEEWLQSDACEPGFQHMADADIVNAAVKEMKMVGMRVKKEKVRASVIAWR